MQTLFSPALYVLFLFPFLAMAQEEDEDYYANDFMRYEDRTYASNIKTVQFHIRNVPLSLPVIGLANGEQLQLAFDDLNAEYQDYTYTVIHCDRNWEPSDIPPTEYINGFMEENIMNYDFSFNTVQDFLHYSFTFPSQNFNLRISGNYVLLVFQDFDREKPIITRRFRVYEKLVEIQAEVRIPMVNSKRRTHHQINVAINYPDFNIRNPLRDVAVHIQQNYRWDNLRTEMKPIFLKDQRLEYDRMGDVLFEGSNEFRWLDIRSLRYQPENVTHIWYDPDSAKNHVFLRDDIKFNKQSYRSRRDLNGAFTIDISEGNDNSREADYTLVHFSLKHPQPIMDGGIYLYGGLTEWQVKPEYRLEFDPKNGVYECTAYLKQGYYNYQYIYLKDGKTEGETELSEASFFQARNIYTFYVYHAQMGSRYDRLIGHAIISSGR